MDHDLAATARVYEQARVVGSDPSVWAVAKAMFFDAPQGHYDDALATLRAAEQKDPLGVTLRYAIVAVSVAAGRIDDALVAASALDKLGSNSSGGWAFSGWAHLKAGNVARAREYLAQLHQIYGPDNWLSVLLGFGIDATTRDHAAAKALLERQFERRAGGQFVSAFVIGEGYKALGDYDKAIAWFTQAVDQHHPHAYSFMLIFNRNDPVIGRDPRFLALIKRMGLEGDQSAAG
jgi:tetratricopeptide (TPR) repeat protein